MDRDEEIRRAKWVLICGFLFLISICLTYRELVFLVRGRTAQATILRTYEIERRGRFGQPTGTRLVVEYQFVDSQGNTRTDSDEVTPEWGIPAAGTIAVCFTPGLDGKSRLA